MFSPTISPLLRWQSIFRMFPCSCRHLERGERHQRYVRRAARWKACTVQITAGWWWSEACWNLVAAWTDKTTRSFCCYRLSTQINPHIGFLPNTKENCAFKRTKDKSVNKNLPFSKKKSSPSGNCENYSLEIIFEALDWLSVSACQRSSHFSREQHLISAIQFLGLSSQRPDLQGSSSFRLGSGKGKKKKKREMKAFSILCYWQCGEGGTF